MVGKTITAITYGIEVLPKDDPYIAIGEATMGAISQVTVPGAFAVDFIPALKYVPDWFPFAGFKRKAKGWRDLVKQMANVPFEVVKRNMVTF